MAETPTSDAASTPAPAEVQTPSETTAQGEAQLQETEPASAAFCSCCKKPVDPENSVVLVRSYSKTALSRRCKACHSLKSRINRVMAKHGNLAADWTKMPEEDKKEFYKNYQSMVGDELLARLQESVTEYKRTSSSVEFTGTGEYYDEEDLKKRYEGKPEQLKNLLANTKTYYCPVKQVWLFEDVTYKRVARDAEETGRVEKRKVQMIPKDDGEAAGNEPEERATKKNKGNKNKDNKSGGSQLPKFKAGEKKKMQRKMEGMTGKRLQLLDLCCKAKSEKLKALVPGYVLSASEKIVDEAITFTSEFERILASDHGDSKDLLERIDRNTEALNEAAARLKCQVEQAQEFLTAEG